MEFVDPLSTPISLSGVATRAPAPDLPRHYLLEATDVKDEYTMEMDYSASSNFMKCARMAENYSVHGRELAKDQTAQSFGRLFHKVEEQRLKFGADPMVIVKQNETIAEHFVTNPPSPTDHRNADMMFQMRDQYNKRYAADQWGKKLFIYEGEPMLERPFKVRLCTIEVNAYIPYPPQGLIKNWNTCYNNQQIDTRFYVSKIHVIFTGRIDAVLEEAGHIWLVDHKTTSRGGEEFWEAFRLSLQTRGYVWALWKLTNRVPMGAIVNGAIVRKPTKTGKGTEYDRQNFDYSKDSLLEWEDNMSGIISDFISCLQRGFFPQMAQSFMSPCIKCVYRDNCALPRHQRASDLASDLYRDVVWNPMLEQ